MVRGWIARYEVRGDVLRQFQPNLERVAGVLESKYSTVSAIELNQGGLIVKAFNEDAFRVLSEIGGDPSYWLLACEYRRQP